VTKDTFLRKVAVLNRDQTKKGVAMQSTTISRTLALPSLPFPGQTHLIERGL
jgi:hypothetical protein